MNFPFLFEKKQVQIAKMLIFVALKFILLEVIRIKFLQSKSWIERC